jgi:hypothetical protein
VRRERSNDRGDRRARQVRILEQSDSTTSITVSNIATGNLEHNWHAFGRTKA